MTAGGSLLAVWPVLVPLAGGALVFAAPSAPAVWIAGATALLAAAASALLGLAVARGGAFEHLAGGWPAPLGIRLLADGPAALLAGLHAAVLVVVLAHAALSFEPGERLRRFLGLALLLWAGLAAVALAGDLFNAYVGLELVTLAAVGLVAQAGEPRALAAAVRYLLAGLVGSMLYLLGVALFYGAAGVLDLPALRAGAGTGPPARAALAFLTAGLVVKTALVPAHFWLPAAHANAPAPASALLSALVIKASFGLLLRLWWGLDPALTAGAGASVLGALGIVAVGWGSLQALRARRLKMLVAHSTVAQIGYLFFAFPARGTAGEAEALAGTFYLVLSHACAKAAFFLGAGNVLSALGHDRLAGIAGIARRLPATTVAFGLAGASLAGLPPTGGFVAKWLLLQGSLGAGDWGRAAVIVLGGLLAGAYALRVVGPALAATEPATVRRVPLAHEVAPLTLALAALALGLVPGLAP